MNYFASAFPEILPFYPKLSARFHCMPSREVNTSGVLLWHHGVLLFSSVSWGITFEIGISGVLFLFFVFFRFYIEHGVLFFLNAIKLILNREFKQNFKYIYLKTSEDISYFPFTAYEYPYVEKFSNWNLTIDLIILSRSFFVMLR